MGVPGGTMAAEAGHMQRMVGCQKVAHNWDRACARATVGRKVAGTMKRCASLCPWTEGRRPRMWTLISGTTHSVLVCEAEGQPYQATFGGLWNLMRLTGPWTYT